jgi:hypothetical protein
MPRKPALITARLAENKEMPQAARGCGYRTANADPRQLAITAEQVLQFLELAKPPSPWLICTNAVQSAR